MRGFVTILGIILLILFVVQGFRVYSYGKISKRLVIITKPFSFKLENNIGNILIIGDSLGVGVGSSVEDSLSGRLHKDFPEYNILNESISGIKIHDGLLIIKNIEKDKQFNFIVIQLGANDITRLTKKSNALSDLRELLLIAHEHTKNVIFVTSGSVGYAPLFIEPISTFYTYRSRSFFKDFENVTKETNTKFVNLYYPKETDPFLKNENKFYAEDKFHPSGEGYGLWYKEIKKVINE